MQQIFKLYKLLLKAYGPQGWWPLLQYPGTNPTKTGAVRGYHPGDYAFPKNREEQFAICLGAFLTQNTAWTAVEKSLLNLQELNALAPERLWRLDEEKFKKAIRPSGYHNQKSFYIKNFIPFFLSLKGNIPTRIELLGLKGIGPETADSMLLYAFRQPEFVIDAYTKRVMAASKMLLADVSYDEAKAMFEEALQQKISDQETLVAVYQEYHALLVEHAKRFYRKKPFGQGDAIIADVQLF